MGRHMEIERVDSALAKQLGRSMELNARMKNRLTQLAIRCRENNPDIALAIHMILSDQDPQESFPKLG